MIIQTLRNRLNSFRYAFQGVIHLFASQPNARIHLVAALVVVAAGVYFRLTGVEWCIVALAIGAVVAAEAFNTSIEHLTDLVSPDFHPLAGKAKDVAAAGVLLTAVGAAVAGCLIFVPKLWQLLALWVK